MCSFQCHAQRPYPLPPTPRLQIHAEVHDFWGLLEAVAASRHHQLLTDLNTHLAALARRVEGAVSERLAVPLAPADIRLRPPSLEQLHGDVQELIEKGGLAVWVRQAWRWIGRGVGGWAYLQAAARARAGPGCGRVGTWQGSRQGGCRCTIPCGHIGRGS